MTEEEFIAKVTEVFPRAHWKTALLLSGVGGRDSKRAWYTEFSLKRGRTRVRITWSSRSGWMVYSGSYYKKLQDAVEECLQWARMDLADTKQRQRAVIGLMRPVLRTT